MRYHATHALKYNIISRVRTAEYIFMPISFKSSKFTCVYYYYNSIKKEYKKAIVHIILWYIIINI